MHAQWYNKEDSIYSPLDIGASLGFNNSKFLLFLLKLSILCQSEEVSVVIHFLFLILQENISDLAVEFK